MQCDGCYYQDRKENVCLHGSPIFDIDDNCTDYVEDDFVKKIRADEREKILENLKECSVINNDYQYGKDIKVIIITAEKFAEVFS